EPLLTYSNTMKSIELLTSDMGLGISPKRITISTAGIAKMIEKLADDNPKVRLALSLHAADDVKRNTIMPINEQNNLDVLMKALKVFYQKTGNKISYEYIAFADFNDSIQDAKNLVSLCTSFPVTVNIIEYNPVEGVQLKKSSEDNINKFAKYLRDHDVMVTVRRSRGKDIDAACGQLANK
ncbi:MAG: 23S rRNA (adenine(2503)-C(2))-methyltransferase RlmN, partial [Saprospiraceae bacterium]|nr:23S rRNA (adenine(2503)-C(2))-methyltransferase RlmN [Saprospiraceae bacterium]